MANCILIIGESGTGKSTSLRNLKPEETFLINVLDKPLPFRGYKKMYQSKEGGNYATTDNAAKIIKIIEAVSKREGVKSIVIDDFQYIMANEFMKRASETGYGKFTEIAQNAWKVINAANAVSNDIDIFFLSHSHSKDGGTIKCKTIGKMLEEKISLEGMFTIVLHALIIDGQYKFLTQNHNNHLAKSPMGMFDRLLIDNDLQEIKKTIHEYATDLADEDVPQ